MACRCKAYSFEERVQYLEENLLAHWESSEILDSSIEEDNMDDQLAVSEVLNFWEK